MRTLKIHQLTFGLHQHGGRNHGRISVARRGSLVKRNYRFLDTKRTMFPGEYGALIIRALYDPNRSGYIALLLYPNAVLAYVLAANYTATQKVVYNLTVPPINKEKGWSNYLKLIPLGAIIFNIELVPGLGAKITKAAGNSAVLLRNDVKLKNHVLIKLKSGEHRLISNKGIASVGIVSNNHYFLRDYKKAGTIRRYGIRPRVRPSAQNPVDHPMAGRTRGGCAPKSRTGKLSLGISTAKKKKKKKTRRPP